MLISQIHSHSQSQIITSHEVINLTSLKEFDPLIYLGFLLLPHLKAEHRS